MKLIAKTRIKELSNKGAIFYCSHSGGKDSQTMYLELSRIVPASQLVVIHAHLPEVEWDSTRQHIKNTIGQTQYIEVVANKTFFGMVDHRQMFPGPKYRQCTSDLKRGPIEKAIRADMKSKGKTLAVNCMGLRAEESKPRSKMETFKLHKSLSKAGRTVYNLLPIHDYLIEQVWQTISQNNQEPHWAYATGMTRLSCCFCIMASDNDLTVAAKENPELYRRYVLKEKELDFTLRQGKSLEEITGITISEVK
ncbi:phosphoadenosine phosphosulfate reductase family protein [Candidatus Babeliales bacterium]|nr:phosphoadenosine phosphosulfate reductase family protein [Candidatus Babeliales bacterium]